MSKPDNLEDRIVETAKVLFIKNGYEQTSMSDIALELGINRPTLHYYFRTKDKLFDAVFLPIVQSFLPRIEETVREDIPFEVKLEKIIDQYFTLYLENPFLPQFVLFESQRDIQNLFDTIKQLKFDSYVVALEEMMKTEIEKGVIKPIPIRILFVEFIGLIITPFLAKNMVMKIFNLEEENYKTFVSEWKQQILAQMKYLLMK